MNQPAYIIINPHSHQGEGLKRWNLIKEDVLSLLPGAKEIITDKKEDSKIFLKSLNITGDTIIVSAGGDGSVHYLINTILQLPENIRSNIILGAIGLGSSNDFLKPFKTYINKIPVRINVSEPPLQHDIGKALYLNENNIGCEKYFIINSSFGATAEGNWNFNNPGSLLRWLKKKNTSLAISYTAITTILSFKNKSCLINYNEVIRKTKISNINLLKIPYVSGSLHYQQYILPNDGQLGLNICSGMNTLELLQTLFNLEKGKFNASEKKISAFVKKFSLQSNTPIVFECDGETEKILKADISILPSAIRVLKS
jgi:diacylglycerol kinase (ATP)